jgi:hypothetical protein
MIAYIFSLYTPRAVLLVSPTAASNQDSSAGSSSWQLDHHSVYAAVIHSLIHLQAW